MFDNPIKKLFGKAKQVKLEKEKKNSIKEAVLVFMKENSLPAQKRTFWGTVFSPRLKPVYIFVSALAVVLCTGGVVSVQANAALPGDILYPVKVGVNENVLQVLAFSDEAKTDLNIQLAEVRLQEAEQLAVEGKLLPGIQIRINNNFNARVDKVVKSIEKLNNAKMYNAAAKISSSFEATLKAHSAVLSAIGGSALGGEETTEQMDSLIIEVDNASKEAFNSGAISVNSVENENNTTGENQPEKSVALEKIAQNRLQSAQNAINEVNKLIEADKGKIKNEVVLKVQKNLEKAEQKIVEGTIKMSGDIKDYRGAIFLFQQALTTARESKLLLKIKTR